MVAARCAHTWAPLTGGHHRRTPSRLLLPLLVSCWGQCAGCLLRIRRASGRVWTVLAGRRLDQHPPGALQEPERCVARSPPRMPGQSQHKSYSGWDEEQNDV
ncbi:hypothetical protein NDU88_006082 [Pleurodeles waltl]|uniref:Secreted protein n=1 Tax=Pleurodeles waltl TaxID=8319 RepID=A0AAV7NPR0_PLEWA|nr:hypothetical protein NDU88_006082 [Pleurodeles waltl]